MAVKIQISVTVEAGDAKKEADLFKRPAYNFD
jgi:hypothetical protein